MSNKPWVQVDSNEEQAEIEAKSSSHHYALPDLIIAPRNLLIEILQSDPDSRASRLARAILRGAWTKGPRMISTELTLAYDADVPPMAIATAIARSYNHAYWPRHAVELSHCPAAILSSNYQPRHLQT